MKSLFRLWKLSCLALGISLFITASLHAGIGVVDPVVTNTNDAGPGSLRDAIQIATTGSTITFDAGLSGETIRLTSGELTIDDDLTIDASPLANGITISGDATGDGPTADDSRVFNIENAPTVRFDSLTISGGKAADGVDGILGGIGDSGGGIFNDGGTLTVLDSTIEDNAAGDGSSDETGGNGGAGGGIRQNGGTLTIRNSTISGNNAGAGGEGSITGGGQGGLGGGIYNDGGNVVVMNTTITDNLAGDGGVEPGNEFTGFGGSGGGIYNNGGGASLTIQNTTITGNKTGDSLRVGGGSGSGGGIFNNGGTVNLTNSIVAENEKFFMGLSPDIFNSSGTVNRFDFNLIGDHDSVETEFPLPGTVGDSNVNGDLVGNSVNPFDPDLGELGANGGPTNTRVPKFGSPVIDFGAAPRSFPTPFLNFTATLSTISGTPFGLDNGDQGTVVSGAFAYDPAIADTNPGDTSRGRYPQTNGFFEVTLPGGTKVTGSMTPFLEIDDFDAPTNDTFRFNDGVPKGRGAMSVNGSPDNDAELGISIVGPGTTFSNDSLPDPFPLTTGNFGSNTFSLKDANGTALLQFQTIEDGTPPVVDKDQRGQPRVTGAAIDLGAVERLDGHQPDLRLGEKRSASTHLGDGAYTATGAGQKLKVILSGKRTEKFYTSIENDGDLDEILLKARPTKKKGLVFKTFRLTGGRTNVTGALKGAGFNLGELRFGEVILFQTKVKNKSGGNLRKTWKFTASSVGDPTKTDRGKPKVIGK